MKSILLDLFYGNINECEKNIKHLYETKEYARYNKSVEKLERTFNKDQQKLFDELCECRALFNMLNFEQMYCDGFKTGMRIGLEVSDFSVSDK